MEEKLERKLLRGNICNVYFLYYGKDSSLYLLSKKAGPYGNSNWTGDLEFASGDFFITKVGH